MLNHDTILALKITFQTILLKPSSLIKEIRQIACFIIFKHLNLEAIIIKTIYTLNHSKRFTHLNKAL